MPDPKSKQRATRILIVDDNPPEVRLLINHLRGAGYELSVALDGEQGYQRAIATQPDLILLDIQMPKMDGLTTCRLLKATEATAAIPIIFLSSGKDIDQRLSGLLGGANDYVTKPYDVNEVLARINIHLKLARSLQAAKNPADNGSQVAAESAGSDADSVLVNAALNYLSNHLHTKIAPEKLAAMVGTHEKRLTQAFRRVHGVTVSEHLRLEKMRTAQRMLTHSALSVVAISEELGFSSPANFASAFLRHAGVTPSVYRIRGKITAGRKDGPPDVCIIKTQTQQDTKF